MDSDDKPLLKKWKGTVNVVTDDEGDPIHYDSFPHQVPSPNEWGGQIDSRINESVESTKYEGQPAEVFKVYKRRWYIVIMFSLYAFCQNFVWNTWGPISDSAEEAFGWHDSTIAWMSNWGPVSYIVSGLFFPWLLQVKGLRWAVLSSSLCVSVGVTFRVFTSNPHIATILIHIGQFFNGLGGPIGMGAVPHLSATWFPPHERVTATALGSCIGILGCGLSFLVGPLLVSDYSKSSTNSTVNVTTTPAPHQLVTTTRNNSGCGFCWLVTLIIMAYFPSKPPTPPAISAMTERESYWAGMWSLRRKTAFLIVAFTYGISLGVLNCWSSVLDVNLKPFGIAEKEAGWIGFYSVLGGGAMSLLIGRFADYFTLFMKFFVVSLYSLGAGAFIVFAIMLIKIIPMSDVLLYVTVIVANTALSAAVPLLFEIACEVAYPTSESAANGVLTYLNNCFGLVFLAVFSFPHIGTMWMNWTVIGSTSVCIPLIAFMKGRFKRLEVDEQVNPEAAAEQEIIVNEENSGPVSS